MSQTPWSVKGIDPKARSVARERAQRQGVTLGQFLNSLLLEGDEAEFREVNLGEAMPRPSSDGDLRRMSQEIDQLAQRLEASTSRSARTVSGLDKSILGLMGKVDATGKAQLHALERVTRAMGEIETTQSALRARIDTLEVDRTGGAALDGLKALDASLGRLSDTLQTRVAETEAEQQRLSALFDEKVNQVSSRVDDVARSVDTVVRSGAAGAAGRIEQVEEKVASAERRIEAGIARIADAASRFEQFETKAERAVGDTTWRMERALESNMTRSRAMSKEVLDRVDAIEEKTREAMNTLGDAVARITERVTRTERKTDTAVNVLERAVNEIDDRVQTGGRAEADFSQLQQVFQKRLDSLAEDMTRPINAARAEMERRLEEVVRSGNPEKMDRMERSIRTIQEQVQVSEARQADAIEAMSAQVDRLSRAVDDRLRAVESRGGDNRSIEDVRREIANLANSIDARLGAAESSTRADIGHLNTTMDDKLQALEKRSAGAIDAVGEQVALVAERLQKRHDEGVQRLSDRITETATESRPLDGAEVDRLADRLDERVRESERRSAEAIGQIGEQVARAVERLQSQGQDSLRAFESRLADSGRSYEARLSDVLADVQRRMEDTAEQAAVSIMPVQNTMSSLARRLEAIEDRRRSGEGDVLRDIPILSDDYIILDDEDGETPPPIAPGVLAAVDARGAHLESNDIVGVEPPPFDRASDPRDAHLFEDAPAGDSPAFAEPAHQIEDLLEADDELLGPPPMPEPGEGFVADLPAEDGRERLSANYLEEARRAARQGRRIEANTSSGRKGIGKGPLIASAVLTVAVAGGGAFTLMRGKQDGQADDFARLDPATPAAPLAPAGASDAVLFGDEHADPGADIFAAAETQPVIQSATPASTQPGAVNSAPALKAAAAAPNVQAPLTLEDAVRAGDPVALHDYALELLQTGEKARAVQLLKEAANRGLVMAEYRLAKLYERGEGVPRDIAASRSWTEKAAIGGNRLAMHDLAVFYAEGDAGPQSYAAAVEWFRAASDLGLVDSQYNLAVLYEQGLGLSQDKAEATYWFEVAGRAGDQDAGRRARALLAEMQPTQAEAIKRKARAFNPKQPIARANGEFGRRAWDVASPAQISETQRLLQKLSYPPGGTDGKMSARTSEAIRQFERANDLAVTGEASVSLLRRLRAATLGDDN